MAIDGWDTVGEGETLKLLRVEGWDSIYEVKRLTLANGAFVTERKISPVTISERVVWVSKWNEIKRIDCFCCTCDDMSSSMDSACRNHGFYGKRPCDIHNTPGYPWEGSNEMPESVLTIRKRQAERG